MNDLITSVIRTITPTIVGALLAWATSKGVKFDPNIEAQLVTILTVLFTSVYYSSVRLLEQKFPKAGVLLGSTKKLTYKKG